MLRQGLADIGEAVAPAERTRRDAGSEGEHRDVLARMVGAVPARIAAVIGADDGDVARPQRGAERGQPGIKGGERGGVARDVAAMAVERVEIVEIREDQGARRRRACGGEHGIEGRRVVRRRDRAGDALAGENIGDLADGVDGAAGGNQAIEQGRCRRRHRIVVAIGGAPEAARCADERARDDAADIVGIGENTAGPAQRIEPLEAEALLMRGDLQHAVGRGIDNRLAGGDVLGAERGNDLGARGVAIAEQSG